MNSTLAQLINHIGNEWYITIEKDVLYGLDYENSLLLKRIDDLEKSLKVSLDYLKHQNPQNEELIKEMETVLNE